MFTQDSLFIFNELLSMRILPSFRNTYKGAYGIIVFSIFTTEDLKGDWTRDLLINALNQSATDSQVEINNKNHLLWNWIRYDIDWDRKLNFEINFFTCTTSVRLLWKRTKLKLKFLTKSSSSLTQMVVINGSKINT